MAVSGDYSTLLLIPSCRRLCRETDAVENVSVADHGECTNTLFLEGVNVHLMFCNLGDAVFLFPIT